MPGFSPVSQPSSQGHVCAGYWDGGGIKTSATPALTELRALVISPNSCARGRHLSLIPTLSAVSSPRPLGQPSHRTPEEPHSWIGVGSGVKPTCCSSPRAFWWKLQPTLIQGSPRVPQRANSTNSLNPQNSPWSRDSVTSPFHRWGNGGAEKLSDLPRITTSRSLNPRLEPRLADYPAGNHLESQPDPLLGPHPIFKSPQKQETPWQDSRGNYSIF